MIDERVARAHRAGIPVEVNTYYDGWERIDEWHEDYGYVAAGDYRIAPGIEVRCIGTTGLTDRAKTKWVAPDHWQDFDSAYRYEWRPIASAAPLVGEKAEPAALRARMDAALTALGTAAEVFKAMTSAMQINGLENYRLACFVAEKGCRDAIILAAAPPTPEQAQTPVPVAHTDHLSRHWDRTCPGCIAEAAAEQAAPPQTPEPELSSAEQFWIERRGAIIEALSARGLEICNDDNNVWLQEFKRAAPVAAEQTAQTPEQRDRDWILAMASALGTNSGHQVPIVPSETVFRKLFDAVRAEQAAPLPQGADARQAFELGWRTAANWTERDDLIADIGSPAYIADRDAAIARSAP